MQADGIVEARRLGSFEAALQEASQSGPDISLDDEAQLSFEADRIYFELGFFDLVATTEDQILDEENAAPWHKALKAWALLRQGLLLTSDPVLGDANAEAWLLLTRWAHSTNPSTSSGGKVTSRETVLEEHKSEWEGSPEVAMAYARLSLAILNSSKDETARADAFDRVRAVYDRFESEPTFGGLLNQAPARVDACFAMAQAFFLSGEFGEARSLLPSVINAMPKHRHVAGLLLRARLDRICGEPYRKRQRNIDMALDALCNVEIAGRIPDLAARTELRRHEAALSLLADPIEAIELFETAGQTVREQAAVATVAPRLAESSHGLPRLYMATGAERKATESCKRLLVEAGIEAIATAIDPRSDREHRWAGAVKILTEWNPSAFGYTGPDMAAGQVKRALIRTADLMRAQGSIEQAIEWVVHLHTHYPQSRSIRARVISFHLSSGRLSEALRYADAAGESNPPKASWINDVLELEVGRCYLANGRLADAKATYQGLTKRAAIASQVSGWSGLIDVERKRRDLAAARDLGSQAQAMFSSRAAGIRAELLISRGWVEIQLGDPRWGFRLCGDALDLAPWELSAWLGVTRSLRLLGRHGSARTILEGLLGRGDARTDLGLPSVPNLRAAHASIVQSELGWCLLDLELTADARREFKEVRERSPYSVSAARGEIAASKFRPVEEVTRLTDSLVQTLERANVLTGVRDVKLEAARALIARSESRAAERFVRSVEDDLYQNNRTPDARSRVLFALADAYLDADDPVSAGPVIERVRTETEALREHGATAYDDRVVMLDARLALVERRPHDAQARLSGLGEQPLGEAIQLGLVVTHYEQREFEAALEQLKYRPDEQDLLEMAEGRSAPSSDVRGEIKAWLQLAMSESPRKGGGKACLAKANRTFQTLDCTSVSERHLSAILKARQYRYDSDEKVRASLSSALSDIESAIRRRPRDPALLRDHAAILLEVGDINRAQQLLHRAAEIDPKDARIQLLAGVSHFRIGETEEAVLHFGRASKLDALDYVHHRALGIAHLRRGEIDAAARAVERGLSKSHPEGRLELRLLALDIKVRRARKLTNPMAVKRMLEGSAQEIAECLRDPHFRHQRVEVRDEYHLLAALVAILLNRPAKAQDLLGKVKQLKSERELLKAQAERNKWTVESVAPRALLIFGVLTLVLQLLPTAFWLARGASPDNLPGLDEVGLGLSVLSLIAAAALPRIIGLSWRDMGVEMAPHEPVPEVVHTDLDLSSSRLLLIGGFSNHRPDVPAEDHEPRLFSALAV